jgi:hypothetical protein
VRSSSGERQHQPRMGLALQLGDNTWQAGRGRDLEVAGFAYPNSKNRIQSRFKMLFNAGLDRRRAARRSRIGWAAGQ